MFFDDVQPHPSSSESSKSNLGLRMMVAEFLHDWFEIMSQVAYQTHRACEFFVANESPLSRHQGRFGPRSWNGLFGESSSSIDMEKLKECLRPMEPTQAAQVVHAVQTMHAMEAMLRRYRSRVDETEGAAW